MFFIGGNARHGIVEWGATLFIDEDTFSVSHGGTSLQVSREGLYQITVRLCLQPPMVGQPGPVNIRLFVNDANVAVAWADWSTAPASIVRGSKGSNASVGSLTLHIAELLLLQRNDKIHVVASEVGLQDRTRYDACDDYDYRMISF
jgi:hypothetical protein